MIQKILQEERLNFNDLEKEIYQKVCILGCMLLETVLEQRDQEIRKSRDKKIYRHKGYKNDCIKTIMGEVRYRKAIYEIEDGENKSYKFLLDETVKISRIGKISANLFEKMLSSVCVNSYRKSAEIISGNTGQRISHEGVRGAVLKIGKEIYEKEKEKVKLLKEDKLEAGMREVPMLFEEADGLWISLQGKDKKEIIKKQKEKAERAGKEYKEPKRVKSELKIYVSHEGWRKNERHTLVEKRYITGFMSSKELDRIRKAKLHERYDLKKIKLMALNGDGASWIKKLVLKGQLYQKDSFHISQAITRNIKEGKNKEKLQEMIKEKSYNEINKSLEELKCECGGEEKEVKKLTILQNYLKDGLPRYKEMVKEMPTAPEGIEYRNMGICESQVFCVLTRRFSDRRMSFSKIGATALSKVVATKVESHGNEILEVVETPIRIDNSVEEWIREIDERSKFNKSMKQTKLGKEPSIKILNKPFEGTALSENLRVIRELASLMSLSAMI